MTTAKQKIRLTAEQETLLVTLYCKTVGRLGSFFDDPAAWRVVDRIEYDFSRVKVSTGTRITVCLRALKFDDRVRRFLASHPQGTVLHLGCGLDTRHARTHNGRAQWYDLDLPDVIDLRRRLFAETDTYHMLPASVTDPRWIEAIPPGDPAVLVVAEGLMMYLEEQDVRALILRLKAAFPGSTLAFDAFSTLTARSMSRHPAMKASGAVVRWGIDDARIIEGWAPGIRLEEEWDFTQSEAVRMLAPGYRLIFKLAALFPMVHQAHRLLFYAL